MAQPDTDIATQADTLPLSVVIVACNEAQRIERCLRSVAFAQDVLVVDSGSTDDTADKCKAMGARTLYREWDGFIGQKQFATDQARHDWVLNIDADEWVDDELAKAIRRVFAGEHPDATQAYRVKRRNWYLGDWLNHGSPSRDYVLRLFNRQHRRWTGYEPHAAIDAHEPVTTLPGRLLHEPYRDLDDHVGKINRYTTAAAEHLFERGKRVSLIGAVGRAAASFPRNYLIRLGVLDGSRGLLLAVLHMFYVYLKWIKLWQLHRRHNGPPPPTGGDPA